MQIEICFFLCILFSSCIGTAAHENCPSGIFKLAVFFFLLESISTQACEHVLKELVSIHT